MVKNYAEQRAYRRGETFDRLAAALGLSVPGLRKWARKGAVHGAALHRGKWVLQGPLTDKRIERVRSSLRLKPALSRTWTERRLGGRRTPKAPLKKRQALAALTRYVNALDRVESTIHDAALGASNRLRVEAVSAFHELCDASHALGCLVAQVETKRQDWARFDSCIPIVRYLIDFQGGSWRDHWLPSWRMLRDDKSLIRRFGDALMPMGLGLIDVPLAKDPEFNQMFADYVSLPSGTKDLHQFLDEAGCHISEWQTCLLKYTERRRYLDLHDSTARGTDQLRLGYENSVEVNSYTPDFAASIDGAAAALIEQQGWNVSKVLKLIHSALTLINGVKEPNEEQITREIQKFVTVFKTFPLFLFADRAHRRLLAAGHPEPTRLEVALMTPPEICLFIFEHDQKYFLKTDV